MCLNRHPSCIDTAQVFGFILNVPSEYKFGFVSLPLRRRHWIALRRINGQYWNLDSKLSRPIGIGDVSETIAAPNGLDHCSRIDRVSFAQDAALVAFLSAELQGKDKELFLIVDSEVERQQRWQRPTITEDEAISDRSSRRAAEADQSNDDEPTTHS